MFPSLLVHAGAGIADLQNHVCRRPVVVSRKRRQADSPCSHLDFAALRQGVHGIENQVCERLAQLTLDANQLGYERIQISLHLYRHAQALRNIAPAGTRHVDDLFNHLVEQVIDMTRPRWRDIPQGLGVTVEMQTNLDPLVPELVGIESELREALTNLILNAVDALPQGGKIEVRTRAVSLAPFSANHHRTPTHVVLEVSDTGSGMDEQTRKHCLEPFFSTKGRRGTGLGLAMVYGVIERHEGKIEIESEPGHGTIMRLVLPIRKAGTDRDIAAGEVTAPTPLQILCIDDEPMLHELLKHILESDGHQVKVTDSGQAGLEAFRAAHGRGKPFDIVITDLGMPYLDGRQVAKALKLESPRTPIVLLTGWGAFMKEDGDIAENVDGVLSKPPRSRELRETLNRLMSQASCE